MSYQSIHTGNDIDASVDINPVQNNRLTIIETKLNTIEEGANKFNLTDNCIKTSHIQNQAITTDKLAPEVADSLASVKCYSGTLLASGWIDEIAAEGDYSSMERKWKWDKFSSRTCDANIRTTLLNVVPTATQYIIDNTITTSTYNTENWGDSYTGRATIYIYCSSEQTYAGTFITDDNGALYLNGNLITTTTSCAGVTVSMHFQKGVNCVEAFYTEGSGGDGWAFSPALGSVFDVMYAVPAHTYTQTIIPTCLDGNSTISTNSVFSPGMTLSSNLSIAEARNKINTGSIVGNSNGSITVRYSHTIPINENITMYWFSKTI